MTDVKLQKAREAHAKAQQVLEDLEAAEATKAATLAAECEERQRQHNEMRVASRVQDVKVAEDGARDSMNRFMDSLAKEPWLAAFAEYLSYRYDRVALIEEADQAARDLGGTYPPVRPAINAYDLLAEVATLVVNEGTRLSRERAFDREEQREAYISGGEA
ncbi:hypothetical protein N4G69_22210 [Streptomyces mirabilis]|uniref:hypothetical protein n=1 Tax=Streptomyces mirabilis TaxID=68239 RepID=UPI0021BF1E1E|nr:hypothetical protein [Streptomyces mirabilis]MCT9108313.1 hypothetical protein [Streptomyces mirabilis]